VGLSIELVVDVAQDSLMFSSRPPADLVAVFDSSEVVFAMMGVVHEILRCQLADSDVPVLI
jgi:hypothetical protein